MNAQDLARIELAKRAYQAAQPREAEIQRGVRRARLALSRTSRRRNWFSKGLVFVVLAVGGLAYAKPQALGELVENILPVSADSAAKGGRSARNSAPEAEELTASSVRARSDSKQEAVHDERGLDRGVAGGVTRATSEAPGGVLGAPVEPARPPSTASDGVNSVQTGERALAAPAPENSGQASAAARPKRSQAASQKGNGQQPVTQGATGSLAMAGSSNEQALSDWGRVGQALAHGDDAKALSALLELARSEDARTRDKADLGRAQLLMANGDLEQGCSLARSLTHRRAGGRIERQALLLLKRCAR